jgi:hypothetical protein
MSGLVSNLEVFELGFQAKLGASAKLSNEAVKCCQDDALQQADHNI